MQFPITTFIPVFRFQNKIVKNMTPFTTLSGWSKPPYPTELILIPDIFREMALLSISLQ